MFYLKKKSQLIQRRFIHITSATNEKQLKERPVPVFHYASKQTKDRLYVWGYAGIGALGERQFLEPKKTKTLVYNVRKPWRLKWVDRTDAKVKKVACGNGFSLIAVASDGRFKGDKLYGTGMNTQSQIGIHKGHNNESLQYLIEPGLVHLPFNAPHSAQIKSISCGRAHSVVLTNEGIFTFGNNSYGQCGRKIVENEEYFGNTAVIQNIENFLADPKADEIVDVKCGQDHTCFLTKSGKLYTCGWSADGQLGQGMFTVCDKPSLVKGDIEGVVIKKVATKGDFVLALSDVGHIYGWGNNEYKQLSMTGDVDTQIGDSRHILLPSYIKMPILDIACSGTHCLILDSNYRLWVWGFGLLGCGPKCDESKEPKEIPQTLLGLYKDLPHTLSKRVMAVNCGLNCSAIIMDDGSLYMWGSNRYGTLGTGDQKDLHFPMKIHLSAQVKFIDCGADQTFAVCRTFV